MPTMAAIALKEARSDPYTYERGMGFTSVPTWDDSDGHVASSPYQALFEDGSILYDTGESRYGPNYKVAASRTARVQALTELAEYLDDLRADEQDGADFEDWYQAVRGELRKLGEQTIREKQAVRTYSTTPKPVSVENIPQNEPIDLGVKPDTEPKPDIDRIKSRILASMEARRASKPPAAPVRPGRGNPRR